MPIETVEAALPEGLVDISMDLRLLNLETLPVIPGNATVVERRRLEERRFVKERRMLAIDTLGSQERAENEANKGRNMLKIFGDYMRGR